MPVFFKAKGFTFYIYSEEGNEPPHIHVSKGNSIAKYWLESPVRLEYSKGYNSAELTRIEEILATVRDGLIAQYNRYLGR